MKVDIAVIGAGITGAGIAQAAAAAGHSVAVIEQNEPACGTSSQSSKLIHGGLRYLESLQFNLVRECLQERQLLLKLAPDLVKMQAFHIPIYSQSSRSQWQIHLGLWMYQQLAGRQSPGFQRLSRQQWLSLDNLATRDLKAVYRYFDAQTDDAALTRAVLQSAENLGAELFCPAKISAIELGTRESCITLADTESITADIIFNCTGPWCNSLLDKVTPSQPKIAYDLIQGSHLLLPKVLENYYYLEAPQNNRAVFATPWQDRLLLGTTENLYTGAPSEAQTLESEQDYLLQVLYHYFPDLISEIAPDQIEKTFCGLRVLAKASSQANNSAFKRSRDCIIQANNPKQPQLVSVIGGKLTSYRAVAEQLIEDFKPVLASRTVKACTRELPLTPPD